MVDPFLVSLVAVLAALVLFRRYRFLGKVFVVRITPGKAVCCHGEISQKFLGDCCLITRRRAVRGWIYGVRSSHGVRLEFSRSLSDSDVQRFRNVFPFLSYSVSGDLTPYKRRNISK